MPDSGDSILFLLIRWLVINKKIFWPCNLFVLPDVSYILMTSPFLQRQVLDSHVRKQFNVRYYLVKMLYVIELADVQSQHIVLKMDGAINLYVSK